MAILRRIVTNSKTLCEHCKENTFGTNMIKLADGGASPPTEHPSGSTGSDDSTGRTDFFLGASLTIIGIIVFPYVFFFIALPEAIISYFRMTIQDMIPYTRDSRFWAGSFLIIRLFGYLLLMIILTFALGYLSTP